MMRKITFLLIAAFCIATVSSADEIHLTTTCNVPFSFQDPVCNGFNEIGRIIIDAQFGQLELKLQGPDGVEGDFTPRDQNGSRGAIFSNGGGYVLLLDSSSNVVARGVFAPRAVAHVQTGVEFFQGSIYFSYLNADSLGIGTGIIPGGGLFTYSRDVSEEPTNFYDLIIDGGSPPVPTPESNTLLLTLIGVGIFGLVKLLR